MTMKRLLIALACACLLVACGDTINPTETIYKCCECGDVQPCEPCDEPTPTPTPTPEPSPTPTPDCVPEWTTVEEVGPINYGACLPADEHQLTPPGDGCYEFAEWAIIYTSTEKCTGETTVAIADAIDFRSCECDTPTMGICHISNKGYSDGNWNLQVSYKADGGDGHVEHVTSPQFCPNDFYSDGSDCTVEKARELAQSCNP
jgi:hypothetical protein